MDITCGNEDCKHNDHRACIYKRGEGEVELDFISGAWYCLVYSLDELKRAQRLEEEERK